MQELYHYGVQGMHWGIRRFQPYKDGQINRDKFVGETTGISLAASGGYGGGSDEDDRKRKQIQDAEDKIKDLQSKFDSVTPPDPTSSNYTDELHAYAKKRKALKSQIKQAKAERDSLLHSDDSCYLEHHGIMGMHWGIRRYQPYPGDYHGDGRFVGKKAQRDALKEAKELVVGLKDRIEVSKIMVEKALIDQRHSQKSLDEAKRNLDETKIEVRVQKALYKENKKLAKQELNEFKRTLKEEAKARQDAFNDVGAKVGLNGSSLGPAIDIPKKNNAYFRRNPDEVNSLQTRMIKEKGGIKTSDTYAKAYSKAYDEAIEKAKAVEFKSNVNKERLIRNAEKSKPSFRTETATVAKRASQMHTSGMTYAQIAKKLGISESAVSYYLDIV